MRYCAEWNIIGKTLGFVDGDNLVSFKQYTETHWFILEIIQLSKHLFEPTKCKLVFRLNIRDKRNWILNSIVCRANGSCFEDDGGAVLLFLLVSLLLSSFCFFLNWRLATNSSIPISPMFSWAVFIRL